MPGKVCVVIGVGPGNGQAFAQRFADDGYRVALIGRSQEKLNPVAATIPGAQAFPGDATDPASLKSALAQAREALGPANILLYNAGSGQWGNFEEITPDGLEAGWRVNVLGLLVAGQFVAEDMLAGNGGSIVITGATASLRGNIGTAAFASAKAGQRALAQSMAKHLGPKGIHVAYVIVDGMIGGEAARARMPEKPEDFFLNPARIADAVHILAHQDRSAWTFELDLRPYGEKW